MYFPTMSDFVKTFTKNSSDKLAVNMVLSDYEGITTLAGEMVYTKLWGSSLNLELLPDSANTTGTFPLELSRYSADSIRLVLVTEAAAVNFTVGATYYYDDDTENHSTDATLLAAGTGNRGVALPKHDRLCDITITAASNAEKCWVYVIGRENA